MMQTADHAMGKNFEPPADLDLMPTPPRLVSRATPLALRIAARLAEDRGAYFNHDAQVMAWAAMITEELEAG